MPTDDEHDGQVQRAREGDHEALADLFEHYRPRLKRLVMLRMDARVRSRIDESDVLQETFIELARRIQEYQIGDKLPFFLWLRMVTGERLIQLHRKHLGAAKRDAQREVVLAGRRVPEASTVFLAAQLAGRFTSVDRKLIHFEVLSRVEQALNDLKEDDREVIAMRHFEELTSEEIALVLGLTRSGVLKRYTRAVKRLKDAISGVTDAG